MDEIASLSVAFFERNGAWFGGAAALASLAAACWAFGKRVLHFIGAQNVLVRHPTHRTQVRTFDDLAKEIQLLLEDNARIYDEHGPNSARGAHGPVRWDLGLWHHLKVKKIVPNNAKIRCLIEANVSVVPEQHRPLFDRMQHHIDAFEVHCEDPSAAYTGHQFPPEFAELIEKHAS